MSLVPNVAVPDLRRGSYLILIGVVLSVLTLGSSAMLAPAIGTASETDQTSRTLVGSQGGGPGWHEYGSVYLLNGTNTT